jgi:hypothetical protein
VRLEPPDGLLQLRARLRHPRGHLRDGLGRADPRDDVLTLRVDQELAVELVLAGAGIAREADASAAVLVQVAEHHRLDVHRGAEGLGDPVQQPVGDGALAVPAPPHRLDRAPQLRLRLLGEGGAGALLDHRLVLGDQRLEVLGRQVNVALRAALLLLRVEQRLERAGVPLEAQHDVPVHLHEPAIRVVREARVAGLLRQRPGHRVVEAEVQDRVHHPRHRDGGARAHADQQRPLGAAEFPPHQLLDARQVGGDFGLELGRVAAGGDVLDAQLGADGEAGRDGHAEVGHLGQAGALAAEDGLHRGRAVGAAAAEEVHVAGHIGHRARAGSASNLSLAASLGSAVG